MGKITHTTIPLRKMCGSKYERQDSRIYIQSRHILSSASHSILVYHRWIRLPNTYSCETGILGFRCDILFQGYLHLSSRTGYLPGPHFHRSTASCYPRFCFCAWCQAAFGAQYACTCIFQVAYLYRSKITIPTIMKQTDKLF